MATACTLWRIPVLPTFILVQHVLRCHLLSLVACSFHICHLIKFPLSVTSSFLHFLLPIRLLFFVHSFLLFLRAQLSFIFSLPAGAYSRLIVWFQFERSIGFFLIQTYIPAYLIVMLSWISFWINHNSTPGKFVSYASSIDLE